MIANESSYEKLVQSLLPKWKAEGSRIKRLHSMVEVPLYVNSKIPETGSSGGSCRMGHMAVLRTQKALGSFNL